MKRKFITKQSAPLHIIYIIFDILSILINNFQNWESSVWLYVYFQSNISCTFTVADSDKVLCVLAFYRPGIIRLGRVL